MDNFCQDRDLLCLEGCIFEATSGPGQQLITGTDGLLDGTVFTSEASDFTSAGVQAGMVLTGLTGTEQLCHAWEIVSVDSDTQLTVSLLRSDPSGDPLSPGLPAETPVNFHVRTFAAQIQAVSSALAEKLRQMVEANGIVSADFADSSQLRVTAACGVLGTVFVARAENAMPHDANWVKAEHYRNEFRRLSLQLRLAIDLDGDGKAEHTRTLGNVNLRRA